MVSWWRRELGLGDTGADVSLVQRKLKCYSEGVYDHETEARVKALQKRLGRPVTGRVDRDTAEALGEAPRASLTPSWYSRALARDDYGADVAELRRMLGLPAGDYFDREVEDAVRRFQSSIGMTPDGVVEMTVATALGEDVPLIQT